MGLGENGGDEGSRGGFGAPSSGGGFGALSSGDGGDTPRSADLYIFFVSFLHCDNSDKLLGKFCLVNLSRF